MALKALLVKTLTGSLGDKLAELGTDEVRSRLRESKRRTDFKGRLLDMAADEGVEVGRLVVRDLFGSLLGTKSFEQQLLEGAEERKKNKAKKGKKKGKKARSGARAQG